MPSSNLACHRGSSSSKLCAVLRIGAWHSGRRRQTTQCRFWKRKSGTGQLVRMNRPKRARHFACGSACRPPCSPVLEFDSASHHQAAYKAANASICAKELRQQCQPVGIMMHCIFRSHSATKNMHAKDLVRAFSQRPPMRARPRAI